MSMSIWYSSIAEGDGDSVLDSREGGDRLTIVDSGISLVMSVVAYCKSDDEKLDVWHFRSMHLRGMLLELRNRKQHKAPSHG